MPVLELGLELGLELVQVQVQVQALVLVLVAVWPLLARQLAAPAICWHCSD